MAKTKTYQGKGPEIVLVGFDEVCCMGYASDKHRWLKEGQQDQVTLGLRMGILEALKDGQGKWLLQETRAAPGQEDRRSYREENEQDLEAFRKRWGDFICENTGLRRLTYENCGVDLSDYQTFQIHKKPVQVSDQELSFLRSLGIEVTVKEKVEGKHHAEVTTVETGPFPFAVDFGGPLPSGWRQDNLGLPPKEVRKMNSALLLAYETTYRILLQSTLHPEQSRLADLFEPSRISLHAPTGFGPVQEFEDLGIQTIYGKGGKPKQLSHSLANTILGYLAPALGIKGKISTHVGACESVMGGIGDALRDLKSGLFDASLVSGYDWAMAGTSFNGFLAAGALITNEDLLKLAEQLEAAGVLHDPELLSEVRRRTQRDQELRQGLQQLARGSTERSPLQRARWENLLNLPKKLYELASMPFHKFRNGFVMSIGAGGGFFTTLDLALEHGLPIRALIAGAGEKVPDGPGDGYGSIAVLGDGVGDAFDQAMREAKANYADFSIEALGCWFAHGTSTPINGHGERREIQRILKKYERQKPLPITGDKEVGHRIGGNFPSEVCYMFDEGEITPLRNYTVSDEALDREFYLTAVVGKAGLGQGKPVALAGDYVAINGAGFGKINTNLIFKKFRLEEVDISAAEKESYRSQCAARLQASRTLAERIRHQEIPLFKDTSDTAKSRGETSNLTQWVRGKSQQ